MTADERLAIIWHKIERANKHVADLNDAVKTFNAIGPYKIWTKHDPQTRKLIYYVAAVKQVPAEIPMILGDCIQNLRTTLDHLAQQLYLIDSGSAMYRDKTNFFIAPSASEYKRHIAGKVEGMRKDAVDALCALEPYSGGKGNDFWVLHRLNNIDKHRALVAVGSSYRSVDIGPHIIRIFSSANEVRELFPGQIWPNISVPLRSADILCPLEQGDELFIDAPDAEVNEQMKFTFDVALYEPEILKPGPMLETIQHLADLVSNTVTRFKPLLS